MSLKNRKEKTVNFIYFDDNPELNVTQNDLTMMILAGTFETGSCSMQLFSFCVVNGFKESARTLLRNLPSDSVNWNDETSILRYQELYEGSDEGSNNDLFIFTEDEGDIDSSDTEEEEEELEEEEQEEEEHFDNEEDEEFQISYDFFFSHPLKYETESYRIIDEIFEKDDIEQEFFTLCAEEEDCDLINECSEKFNNFYISGSHPSIEKYLSQSISLNKDDLSLFLVKRIGLDVLVKVDIDEFLEILDSLFFSTCRKTLDFLCTEEILSESVKNFPNYSGGYEDSRFRFALSYFTSFFLDPNQDDEEDPVLRMKKMIDGGEEQEEENKYAKILGDVFEKRYCQELHNFKDLIHLMFKFPIPHRQPDDEDDKEEDEETKKLNSEYQEESFFEAEDKDEKSEKNISRNARFGWYRRLYMFREFVSKRDMLRVMRKAGVTSASWIVWDETRFILTEFLEGMIQKSMDIQRNRMYQGSDEQFVVGGSVKSLEFGKKGEGKEKEIVVTEEDVREAIRLYQKDLDYPYLKMRGMDKTDE